MRATIDKVPPAQRLFAHLPRADQRRWAGVYVQGLLSAQGKKTLRRIAASVTPSLTAPQSLQQLVNDSAWPWRPVRSELARWVTERAEARAWTLSPVIIPKRGHLSAGVHRRFVPALGRTVNCQLAVGAFHSGDLGSLSVDWRLYLPPRWIDDPALRRPARIPEATGHATTAELCLALVDRLSRLTPRMPPVVVHTDGQIDALTVIEGLGVRGLDWCVSVPGTELLTPAPGTDRPAAAPAPPPAAPRPAGELLRRHARIPHLRTPHGGQDRLGTVPVLLPGNRPALLAGVRTGRPSGSDRLWLTSVPRTEGHLRVLALLGPASATRIGDREADLGLHDFAGRSYPGWHRHATLVSIASAHRALGQELCPARDGD